MKEILLTTKDGIYHQCRLFSVQEYIDLNIFVPAYLRKNLTVNVDRRKANEQTYQNIFTFDIETSTTQIDEEYITWLYHWQMCIDGVVITGRTWDEWFTLLRYIHPRLALSDEKKAIIYIHNLSYEMAFLYKRLPLNESSIFATDRNEPLTVRPVDWLNGFEFRCTYRMTHKSLENLSIDLRSCPYQKDKNDIDHTVIRTEKTLLTDTELSYCAKDVLIPYYYILDLLHNGEKNIFDIPLTQTGFVRRACRRAVKNNKEWTNYRKKQKLTAEQFYLYNKAYRGGDTHSNAYINGNILQDIHGYDITSSYPAQLLLKEFPADPPQTIYDVNVNQFKRLQKFGWLWVGKLELHGVRSYGFNYIPFSRVEACSKNRVIDNGRIVEADFISLYVTSVDYEIIKKNYHYKLTNIPTLVYHTRKALLPECFRDFISNYYIAKTKYKGIEEKERQYSEAKVNLNSIYGMCVTMPLHNEYAIEEDEWITKVIDLNKCFTDPKAIEKKLHSRNNFLPYQIGVWVTAYARQQLHIALERCGMEAVYWDTDSVKFLGDHKADFEKINKEILKNIHSEYGEKLSPCDSKGIPHPIGLWDEEYPDGITFKTFGAKKYVYKDNRNGKEVVTVAGLNKNKAREYLQNKYGSVLNLELNEVFNEDCSGRTYAVYSLDKPFTYYIDGVKVHELTYISIIPTTYTLSETAEYKLYILLEKAKFGKFDRAIDDSKITERIKKI